MKKFLKFLVLMLVLIPTIVKADVNNFSIVKGASVDDERVINASSVVAGNNVTSSSTIKGIGMLLGNNVNFKGISDYALLAGNNVILNGTVNNDGAIFGNAITFEESFISSRDIIVFGNTVTLNGVIERDVVIFGNDVNFKNVKINGNARVYGDNVVLSNVTIKGDILIYGRNVTVQEAAVVNGKLSYVEDADINIASTNIGATEKISGGTRYLSYESAMYSIVYAYAALITTFVGLGLVVPSLFKRISSKYNNFKAIDFFATLGFGALALVGVPIVGALLCMTILGIGLGLLLMALYVLVLVLTLMISGYFVGHIICTKIIKRDMHHLLVGLIGISTVYILTLVPIINVYVVLTCVLLTLGIVVRLFKKD